MNKFRAILALTALLGLAMLQGCGGDKVAAMDAERQDLAGHSFVLTKINGEAHSIKNVPTLGFNEEMRAYGSFCNRFMGQAEVKGGVLTVSQMASTMMMCPDQVVNNLERDGSQLLMNGAKTSFDGSTLVLSSDDYSLEYRLEK